MLSNSMAKAKGVSTAKITGHDRGKLRNLADFSVHFPVSSTQNSEDLHLNLTHLVMLVLMPS